MTEDEEHGDSARNHQQPPTPPARSFLDAFNMTENPFRYFEARLEENVDCISLIESPMSRKIGVYMENRVSCIIEGERGVGKSSLILSLTVCGDEMKPSRVVYRSLSPVSSIEILDQIYMQLETEEADRRVHDLWTAYVDGESVCRRKHGSESPGRFRR